MTNKHKIPLAVRVVSDLHLEFNDRSFEDVVYITSSSEDEVLLIVGDLCNKINKVSSDSIGTKFLDWAGQHFKKVIYIAGNHEHYGSGNIEENISFLRNRYAHDEKVTFLEKDYYFFEKENVVIWGATLWAGFEIEENPFILEMIRRGINDFGGSIKKFSIEKSKQYYVETIEALKTSLREIKGFERKPTVVVATHFAPYLESIHHKYIGNPLNPYFVNDVKLPHDLEKMISYWFHGHTHDAMRYIHQEKNGSPEIKVLSNPGGYGHERSKNGYSPNLVIEI